MLKRKSASPVRNVLRMFKAQALTRRHIIAKERNEFQAIPNEIYGG